jgi:Ribbon-helix-helix domain
VRHVSVHHLQNASFYPRATDIINYQQACGEVCYIPGLGKAMVSPRRPMKPLVVRHGVYVAGHKTSVSVEDEFWKELIEIAKEWGCPHRTLRHKH